MVAGVAVEYDLERCKVASVDDTSTVPLDKPVCGSVRFITAASGVFDTPTLSHMKPFGVPDVSLHPSTMLFLS